MGQTLKNTEKLEKGWRLVYNIHSKIAERINLRRAR